jgi:acyl carrier protein
MNSISLSELKLSIKKLLVDVLEVPVNPSDIGDDEDLWGDSVLDSVATLELLVAIEREYGIVFDDAILIKFFNSITEIAELTMELLLRKPNL